MKLTVTLKTNEFEKNYECENTENVFYKAIGETLLEIDVPNQIEVTVSELPGRHILYDVTERGTYKKGGIEYPSMYVAEIEDTVHDCLELSEDYKHVFLTCINPESNNYKFYEIIPSEEDFFTVNYGRINADLLTFNPTKRSTIDPYDLRLYWIRYYEKLTKGYVDNTDLYVGSRKNHTLRRKSSGTYVDTKGASLEEQLYRNLMEYSQKVVNDNLVFTKITEAQLKRCNDLYYELCSTIRITDFNNKLLELLAIAPRKVKTVADQMAHTPQERKSILLRENSLLNSMNAVFGYLENGFQPSNHNPFTDMDIELYSATYEQREHVLDHLYGELKSKVRNIYRVISHPQKERFEKYLTENNITEVKELWHGSRNENWLSIIKNGLLLYPDAVITGKMFGDGIYFASNIYKSLNYTSLNGAYWTKGSSMRGYMGLYATAYGEPKEVYSAKDFTEQILKAEGKNCVHAKAGQSLANDEIVFYNEAAILLNYIVEFEDK